MAKSLATNRGYEPLMPREHAAAPPARRAARDKVSRARAPARADEVEPVALVEALMQATPRGAA